MLPDLLGTSSVLLEFGSRVGNVDVREDRLVRRLFFRKRLELTDKMDVRLSSIAGVGLGEAGGVETGVWTLFRREEGACSSYLK
jgi:hypothetical protein